MPMPPQFFSPFSTRASRGIIQLNQFLLFF
jgi:hypothetical protein